jgi:membrane-associated PAP2 superfamily phosphatase
MASGMPSLAATPVAFRRALRMFRREAEAKPFAAALGLLALISLVFLLAPRLDLAISGLFYAAAVGFLDDRYPIVALVREAGRILEWALAIIVSAPLAIKVLFPDVRLLVRPRASLFVLTSFVLGPGLLVNGLLKEHWGRARPREILSFGGEAEFSPVWWISDQCDGNCSFVSGEAASAFWLVALVFIVPREWRPATAKVTISAAAAISLTRIAAGAHFMSDVLIAWLLTLLVMMALNRLILKGLPPAFDAAVEDRLARAGQALRKLGGFERRRPSA